MTQGGELKFRPKIAKITLRSKFIERNECKMFTLNRLSSSRIRDHYDPTQGNFTPYERQTLAFCQRWLRGDETFLLHTSGSTGTPKPITLHRQQMEASACLTGAAIGLQHGDNALVCLNTAYIAGIMMLVRGMVLGLNLTVIPPTRRPLATFGQRAGSQARFQFTALVPLQVQTALQHAGDHEHLNGMKAILIGGAPMSDQLISDLQSLDAICYHTYGMTETVSHVALRQINGEKASDRFVPLSGVELALDGRGCLTITGPMTLGETVVTNDRVELAADGSFVWLGRVDNVINSGGVKVQAEQVERAVQKAFGGKRVFVVGLPDEQLGEAVTAFVEWIPMGFDFEPYEQAVTGLGAYDRPKKYIYLEKFVETPTGKVDKIATVRAYNELQ